ncbi:lysylphosphatidylglycerol synthase domain-containing protein [Terrabacter sp. MAHUQ-38]|uniref:lysylphosphatidylglycerol synthase domain-containing protein n=1 Tax=unclassified Terrabacter TaxID=2630222 RepID=UPI00165D3903|nr:lysylphosphatidylglycerol synthase domain-containing protein [Terrabacter sp. MAHUQ-38]MBC9821010.1 flippase-like domain-containing protein [Terrabacter sp. MAHUQ-38]
MRRYRSSLRPLVGAVILAVLVWRLGSGPFVDAVLGIDARSLAAAALLAALTTVCGAWRWVLVARGLGVELSLRSAVAECYRSQFLNVTLPGGVIGDVRRGVRHGRDVGDLGRGLRSVVWERSAGQFVLGGLTLGALLLLPSPLHPVPAGAEPSGTAGASAASAVVALGTLVAALAALLLVSRRAKRSTDGSLPGRVVRAALADVRAGLLGRHTWPGVVAASAVVVAGHVVTFVVAARSAGVTAPLLGLAPLALVVLVAMGLPLNVAGWGPREGAAAWAFGAAGLGASAGVGTAVVYGVMVLVASLPGAALLVVARRAAPARDHPLNAPALVMEGGARG